MFDQLFYLCYISELPGLGPTYLSGGPTPQPGRRPCWRGLGTTGVAFIFAALWNALASDLRLSAFSFLLISPTLKKYSLYLISGTGLFLDFVLLEFQIYFISVVSMSWWKGVLQIKARYNHPESDAICGYQIYSETPEIYSEISNITCGMHKRFWIKAFHLEFFLRQGLRSASSDALLMMEK